MATISRTGTDFEAASLAHPDIRFGKVDTEAEQGLARSAQISSIPTSHGLSRRHLALPRGRCPAGTCTGRVDHRDPCP